MEYADLYNHDNDQTVLLNMEQSVCACVYMPVCAFVCVIKTKY